MDEAIEATANAEVRQITKGGDPDQLFETQCRMIAADWITQHKPK
jgi:hypothetical protein